MTSNSQSTKSLGQVAYEAHTPDYRVQWDDLWLGHRKAWQAAAEAVARECWDRGVVLPEVSAVIEAAKACVPELRNWVRRHYELFGTSNPHYKNEMAELLEAVEALQEVE